TRCSGRTIRRCRAIATPKPTTRISSRKCGSGDGLGAHAQAAVGTVDVDVNQPPRRASQPNRRGLRHAKRAPRLAVERELQAHRVTRRQVDSHRTAGPEGGVTVAWRPLPPALAEDDAPARLRNGRRPAGAAAL